jgi:hypothetical protein
VNIQSLSTNLTHQNSKKNIFHRLFSIPHGSKNVFIAVHSNTRSLKMLLQSPVLNSESEIHSSLPLFITTRPQKKSHSPLFLNHVIAPYWIAHSVSVRPLTTPHAIRCLRPVLFNGFWNPAKALTVKMATARFPKRWKYSTFSTAYFVKPTSYGEKNGLERVWKETAVS